MIKKIILLGALLVNLLVYQNAAFAGNEYETTFYVNGIQKKIERNWLLPEDAKGKSAVVSFTVNNDGYVSNVNMVRSSDNDLFDKSVVSAVYKATPFHHPSDIEETLNIEFFFSPVFTSAEVLNDNSNDTKIINVSRISPYINFSDYTDSLQNKINDNWNPKSSAKEKTAIASIQIAKDGALNNFYIVKSSRNKNFDRDILDTIAASVPMDSFPEGINAPMTDIQLTFNYSKPNPKDKNVNSGHYVFANVMNIKGYDKYTQQAEQVLADSFKGKRYFHYKDLIVELKINKTGKLKYVKIQKSSGDKNFDRKMLAILQKTSFPPVPETIPFDDVTLNYEIVTQRGRTFNDFIFDYLIFGGTTGLKSFNLSKEQY